MRGRRLARNLGPSVFIKPVSGLFKIISFDLALVLASLVFVAIKYPGLFTVFLFVVTLIAITIIALQCHLWIIKNVRTSVTRRRRMNKF